MARSFDFEIDTSALTRDLRAAIAQAPTARREILRDAIHHAEKETVNRFVPHALGNLSDSIAGTVDADGMGATLKTQNVAYAIVQETDHTLDHSAPDHDPGPTGERGADYIGRGIREGGAQLPRIAAYHARKLFGG